MSSANDPPRPPLDPEAEFAAGRLIGLPTETVYGLAAPIDRPDLVERIFALKGRPPSNPLIVHVGSLEQARSCVAHWPPLAERLAERFWPGPLTLVLPRAAHISPVITAGHDTVALRMPGHPLALAILRACRSPLVAPSANLFTRLSPTRAEDVRAVFSSEDVTVVDGGPCRVGIESTIIAIDETRRQVSWLRPGMISRHQIEAELPDDWQLVDPGQDSAVAAPGRMREHYRPAKPLTVRVIAADVPSNDNRQWIRIELPDQADQAARELYQRLRAAEASPGGHLLIELPRDRLSDPRWAGIINRLRKAASDWREES
jgi:L-threonylcarbamoyladenylate synthase